MAQNVGVATKDFTKNPKRRERSTRSGEKEDQESKPKKGGISPNSRKGD